MGRRKRKRRNLLGDPSLYSEPPSHFDEQSLYAKLQTQAEELGLWLCGVTDASPANTYSKYLEWCEQGYQGDMGYLSRQDRLARREDLSVVLEHVRSVILVALKYWPGQFPEEMNDPKRGVISCYAWGEDYHDILGEKLKALSTWLVEQVEGAATWYVDTGAVQERELGSRAGLGFVGKNTMLIHPKYGSGFFLGEIFTTIPIPPSSTKSMPSCGSCSRCLDLCPTQAFVSPYVLDARKCISYLTIEYKGSIPEELRKPMGQLIYGCDICQQVCPWNKFAGKSASPLWGDDVPIEKVAPQLEELLQLDEEEFRTWFEGSPILRVGRARFLRNVAVALGNSGQRSSIPVLEQALQDPEPLIREHAEWAIKQIQACTS